MRIFDQVIKAVTIANASSYTFQGQDFPVIPPGFGVIGITFEWTGAGVFPDLSRVRVRAGDFLAVDIAPAGGGYLYFQRWIDRFARVRDQQNGSASGSQFILPLNLLDRIGDDAQDLCQLPRGRPLSAEIVNNSAATFTNMYVGLIMSNIEPAFAPQLLAFDCNVGANVNNGRLNQPPVNGIARAIALPHPSSNAPTRWKITHSIYGTLYNGRPLSFRASQRLDDRFADQTVVWLPIGDEDNGLPASPGDLIVEVDTAATTLIGVESAVWNILPLAT
jgi:hypothetical protein